VRGRRSAVDEKAVWTAGGKELFSFRQVYGPDYRKAGEHRGHRDRVQRDAVNKIARAIERVDHPAQGVICDRRRRSRPGRCCILFSNDRVLRPPAAMKPHDGGLGFVVGAGYFRAVRLAANGVITGKRSPRYLPTDLSGFFGQSPYLPEQGLVGRVEARARTGH
jgi:hypothetical protein